MIKPGMFISDRYEIIDKVGSGGMADVYKAKCHRLNRFVAIKILKAEFSSDKSFVQKFRAEAQSVAGLSHPNIVSVYDVGDDDGLHYIVMELVEGITLKRFIERKKRLEIKEAVGIAIQICQGMEAAHTHHIIHRDIKPQNIIISREGKVKVADFGIAKAATSNTISQNAIGSVHYLSPEQARGGYSDERSDIYSLGVTLYEMLTGQVPFAGDNSVSVALLHIQSEATPVQVLNPDVPTSVDRIVQKCMQKKPERRYQSASELIKDLKRSIINPDGDYVTISTNAVVSDSPTRDITDEELSTIKSHTLVKKPRVEAVVEPEAPVRKKKKSVHKETEEIDSMNSTLEKVITGVSVVFALALIVVIFYVVKLVFFTDETPIIPEKQTQGNVVTEAPEPTSERIKPKPTPTEVPTPTPSGLFEQKVSMIKVISMTVDDAKATLLSLSKDFKIDYSEEAPSDEYEAGIVCDQYPAPDVLWDRNGTIHLTVSTGPEQIELDDVSGWMFDSAQLLLRKDGYDILEAHEFSSTVNVGCVTRTDPAAGMPAKKGQSIIVYVSDGPDLSGIQVPSIIGNDKAGAKKLLKNLGLTLGKASSDYSDIYPKDIIIAQSPEFGDYVEEGTKINYTVSLGAAPSEADDNTNDNTSSDGEQSNTDSSKPKEFVSYSDEEVEEDYEKQSGQVSPVG